MTRALIPAPSATRNQEQKKPAQFIAGKTLHCELTYCFTYNTDYRINGRGKPATATRRRCSCQSWLTARKPSPVGGCAMSFWI